MYLKHIRSSKTGRTSLSMVQSYYDKEKRCSRTKTLKTFGYIDELQKKYPDPVAHFEKVVDEYNKKAKQEIAEYTIVAGKGQEIALGTINRKNYGYIIIMKLFYELGLDRFLQNRRQRDTKIECSTNTIMKMLVISRILAPGSKKSAFENMGRYFDFEKENALLF